MRRESEFHHEQLRELALAIEDGRVTIKSRGAGPDQSVTYRPAKYLADHIRNYVDTDLEGES